MEGRQGPVVSGRAHLLDFRFSAGEGMTGQAGRAVLRFAMGADAFTVIGTGIAAAPLDVGLTARLQSGFTDAKRGQVRLEERRPAASGRGRFVSGSGLTRMESHFRLGRT